MPVEKSPDDMTSLAKLRKLFVVIKESRALQQELKEMCTLLGTELCLPVVDVNFNSTLKMLEKAISIQQPLRVLCAKCNAWKELQILKSSLTNLIAHWILYQYRHISLL